MRRFGKRTNAFRRLLKHTHISNKRFKVAKSRGRKVKSLSNGREGSDVFWMSLEEAKQAINDKYEFLVDRYDRRKPKKIT